MRRWHNNSVLAGAKHGESSCTYHTLLVFFNLLMEEKGVDEESQERKEQVELKAAPSQHGELKRIIIHLG